MRLDREAQSDESRAMRDNGRSGYQRVGGGFLLRMGCAAAFTSSWTGVVLGGVKPVDVALSICLLVLLGRTLADVSSSRIHFWTLAPPIGVGIIVSVDSFFRPESFGAQSVDYFVKTIASMTLVALIVEGIVKDDRTGRRLWYLVWSWLLGAVVNAAAAVAIDRGVSLDSFVVEPPSETRISGLTFHPNSLAFTLAIALPVSMLLFFRSRRLLGKTAAASSVIPLFAGLYLADSRAGFIVGLLGLGLAVFAAATASRFHLGWLPWVTIIAGAAAYFYIIPSLSTTRLAGNEGAESNAGRVIYNGRAFDTFLSNPFVGGGFGNQGGVAVPLELLSAGGLVLFVAYYFFVLVVAGRLLRGLRSGIAEARLGLVVLAAALSFGLLNPGSTERATFWVPLAVAAVIRCRLSHDLSNADAVIATSRMVPRGGPNCHGVD